MIKTYRCTTPNELLVVETTGGRFAVEAVDTTRLLEGELSPPLTRVEVHDEIISMYNHPRRRC